MPCTLHCLTDQVLTHTFTHLPLAAGCVKFNIMYVSAFQTFFEVQHKQAVDAVLQLDADMFGAVDMVTKISNLCKAAEANGFDFDLHRH